MKKFILKILLTYLCLFLYSAPCFARSDLPQLFLFLGGDEASLHKKQLENSCVSGAQIIYSWKQLEPKIGVYDFSKILKDLTFLNSIHKTLFIQLQDRSFAPNIFNVPDYIREDEKYHGGVAMQYDFPGEGKPITEGWVARVWDPAVRIRFQLLIKKLSEKLDGKIYGINLPETAADFDLTNPPNNFTFDSYFSGELDNISALKKAFHKSIVMQYVNFFPGEWNNDHHYMSRFFSYAIQHHIGLGGPDTVPYKDTQMKNSYPFFHHLKRELLTGMAIQEPDYNYKNPVTGDYYNFFDFYHFTKKYLGASLIFWNIQEPFFSDELVPKLNERYFSCQRAFT